VPQLLTQDSANKNTTKALRDRGVLVDSARQAANVHSMFSMMCVIVRLAFAGFHTGYERKIIEDAASVNLAYTIIAKIYSTFANVSLAQSVIGVPFA